MEVEHLPAKRTDIDADYVVRQYRAGQSSKKIAREFGVTDGPIRRILTARGVTLLSPRIHRLPVAELASRYQAGASELALSKLYRVDRNAIRRRLITAGVPIRDRSAAETLKWSQMSPERREAQVSAAHAATRGGRVPFSAKLKRAITVQARGLHISPGERALAAMLQARGIDTVPQQAIGPYNCDLGAYPVAVEVFGGEWHWTGNHLLRTPRRFRYIMKAGWHVLVLHVANRSPLTDSAADHVAAHLHELRREPTARREYRVIRSTGETVASGRVDDEKIAIIPALTLGRDIATGRYKGIPR